MNPLQTGDSKFGNLLVVVISIQIVTCVTMILDLTVARQVFGFLSLTFLPGIVILKLFKFRDLSLTETVFLSVGLSIAFLMFIGLLINELLPMTGILKPLSQWPLMIIISLVVLVMCFLGCLTNKEDFNINITAAKGSKSFRILPIVFLPFLSVAGALLVNVSQNNFLLLFMIITISVLIVLCTLSNRLIPSRFYSLVLLMIAVALLFHTSLATTYISGWDINVEYYSFKSTQNSLYWNSTIARFTWTHPEYSRVNGMLSTTMLPTIFAVILNVSETWILKIVYPLIFSFVPLGLYQLYKERSGEKVAFVSTFLFMANSVFFMEMLGLARQMVGELFFVLLFFVLLKDKFNSLQRSVLFMIFSAALTVSHYSLSYIFMFYVFLTWLSVYVLKKRTGRITASFVVMLFVMLFSWYIYVSGSGPFIGLVSMGNHVFRSILTEFFNPLSRGRDVLRGLGLESVESLWHLLGRVFAYVTEFLIVVGFIGLLNRQRMKILASEYLMFLSLSMVMLMSCVVVPSFAESLRMTRYFHTLLILLSPMCVLGGETVFSFLARRRVKAESCILILVLIVLVPYFFFQTGFVYEVTGDTSWSLSLSRYRMGLVPYSQGLIDEEEVFGAIWLSKDMNVERTLIYADDMAKTTVLTSYGMINRDQIEKLSNTTRVLAGDAVYLRRMNLIYGVLFAGRGYVENMWNITEIYPVLTIMNKVYSNGGCEIYKAMYNQTTSR